MARLWQDSGYARMLSATVDLYQPLCMYHGEVIHFTLSELCVMCVLAILLFNILIDLQLVGSFATIELFSQ